MTGKLEGVGQDDRIPFAAAALSEAGLRTRLGKEPPPVGCASVKCEEIDAVEIIAVIENFYEVEFSQADHDALCELTKRGYICVGELAEWLGDCEEERRKNA